MYVRLIFLARQTNHFPLFDMVFPADSALGDSRERYPTVRWHSLHQPSTFSATEPHYTLPCAARVPW